MEDSSANPYIPEQPARERQKLFEQKSPLGKVVKIMMIITAVVSVLVGIGLYFIAPLTSVVDQPAREKLAGILQSPELTRKRVAIKSDVGFRLSYDNRLYTSYAEVGDSTSGTDESSAVLAGETYENNDLRTPRDYNYVRIRPIESVDSSRALQTLPPELEIFATMSDDELSTAQKLAENKDLSKLSLFVKLDGDKRQAKKVADDNTVVSIEVSQPVSVSIGDVDYQKVRYTTTNENYRITNVKYDDCYYTIQFEQPYSVCVTNVRPNNVSVASLVEQVFDSITYESAPVAMGDYQYPLARLTQATDTTDTTDEEDVLTFDAGATAVDELPLAEIEPRYVGDEDALKAIAKSQPSVVRIGMLYCADLVLKFESGATATTLTDACVGQVSNGAIISKDGYVATTAHAIRAHKKAAINGYINFAPDRTEMLDRLDRILDYLLKAKIILQSDADYLSTAASIGDQEALAKIQNIGSIIPDNFITPDKEEYTYAIQPTDKPIVVNRGDASKPSFAYSDTVLKADYVASEYDVDKSLQEVFGSDTPKSDVGLLKMSGSFQEVPLDRNENTKSEDTLSTVGYTAYTDSSLTIDKIRDFPIATTSKVEQAYEKEGVRLVQTDLPVLPGNDGAPVFNSSGKLMGFAIYGLSYCPDQECFANGTVRSNAELLKLLGDNNINLQTGSQYTMVWREGVDQFFRANYAASSEAFAAANSANRFNRWADPLNKLSVSLEGSEKDTSLLNQLMQAMIYALIAMVSLTALLFLAFIIHKKRMNRMFVGHYGSEDALQPVMPQQPPAMQPSVPVNPPSQPTPPSPPTKISVTSPSEEPKSKTDKPMSGAVEDPFYK